MIAALIKIMFIVLGAIQRFIDGMSRDTTGIPTGVRNVMTALLAIFASAYGLGHLNEWFSLVFRIEQLWLLLPAILTTASIIVGFTNWGNPYWQFGRFALPAALIVVPMVFFGQISVFAGFYVLACGLAGLSYPLLFWLNDRNPLPTGWVIDGVQNGPHTLIDGPESYARLVLGGVLIGGLAFL